jgi:hypothetical protein
VDGRGVLIPENVPLATSKRSSSMLKQSLAASGNAIFFKNRNAGTPVLASIEG